MQFLYDSACAELHRKMLHDVAEDLLNPPGGVAVAGKCRGGRGNHKAAGGGGAAVAANAPTFAAPSSCDKSKGRGQELQVRGQV